MNVKTQTLKEIRNYFTTRLKKIYPEQEISSITNLIFKTLLGIERLHLLTEPNQIISSLLVNQIIQICHELETGKPIQYILGETSFCNCIIKVNNQTLIPRPETEELVELIIMENIGFKDRILDIGTGSGCIAIAIKKNLEEAELTGIDISDGALQMASNNAKLNKVNVSFLKRDILKYDSGTIPYAEIIVSNPPYVMESEKLKMKKNVLDFEPHNALFVPDEDPLIFYNAIIDLSLKNLLNGGRIYFEINERKGGEICALLESAGYSEVRIIKDINSKERFVIGRLHD
jgi:release factor glutamine methyltransferase